MQDLTGIQNVPPGRLNSPSQFATMQSKTILYVEDDEHDIFFLKRALANLAPELEIQNVASVGEAMRYLSGDGPYSDRARFPAAQLVLSDLSIPGGSGYELVTWIREKSPQLPVVLLSGSAQEPQIARALTSGANFCLEKSTEFNDLVRKVRQLLRD